VVKPEFSLTHFLRSPLTRRVEVIVLGGVFVVLATLLMLNMTLSPSNSVTLSVGQVAPSDILAPMSITYESAVLTRLARQSAADAVDKIYDPPNPAVLRQQVQIARNVLDYIADVRADNYATDVQRIADLSAITALTLPSEKYTNILDFPDDDWKAVDGQTMLILERTMRNEIREDRIQDTYATLPNLLSFTLNDAQSDITVALVRELIKPNSFYNDDRTRNARSEASLAVQPVTRSFAQGQIVVRAGSIVSEADIEALARLKLLQPWDQRARMVIGAVLSVLLVSALMLIYLRRFFPEMLMEPSRLIIIGALFLLFLIGGRIFSSSDPFIAHLYPAAALGLIVTSISNPQVAIASIAALAALIGIGTGASLEYATIVASGGVAGVLTLRRVERLNSHFAAGLMVGLVNIVVTLLFGLLQSSNDPIKVVTALPAGILNGLLAAGLGLVGLYIVTNILNIPTSIKLLELSQPSQPLLQRLLREAPGTYQHSLQVANLAELAAERVGANAALVRVASLYHDIGKLISPLFFGENQVEGVNPHEQLSYEESARIIISHVTEGEKMARKHHLPEAIIDFILQHHGTTQVVYFYNKALEAVNCDLEKVNRAAYTYPGPRPNSREAGIMMLADTSESIIRSKRTRDKQQIEDTVKEIIQSRLETGQLNESGLTVNDLRIIQEVFVSSLQGVFHPRIAYPATPRPNATQEMPILTPKGSQNPGEVHS